MVDECISFAVSITLLFSLSHVDTSPGAAMKVSELRPGMEHVDIKVTVKSLNEPREVLTSYGITHNLVDGVVEDVSGSVGVTVWNEKLELLEGVSVGILVELRDCFITSFRGELSINVGRDSELEKI